MHITVCEHVHITAHTVYSPTSRSILLSNQNMYRHTEGQNCVSLSTTVQSKKKKKTEQQHTVYLQKQRHRDFGNSTKNSDV